MAHIRERPPLRVSIDVETPSGRHYRWAEDEPDARNVPNGLRFSDTMPGGFESFDCTLPRKPGVDYSDLERLSTITVRGASGDIAGEYRLERAPRTSGDQMAISPSAVGWQAHLEDDKSAREIYIDQDISRWAPPSAARRLSLATSAFRFTDASTAVDQTNALPAIIEINEFPAPLRQISEVIYNAGPGLRISKIRYAFNAGTGVDFTNANWSWGISTWNNDALTGGTDTTGDLSAAASGSGFFNPTEARQVAQMWFQFAVSGAGTGERYELHWQAIVLYGDHDLTLRGSGGASSDPGGYYASDIVGHAVGRWASSLTITTESVQQSGFIIPHFTFPEPTTAGEIVRQATRFGLQDWGVWENKVFWWHERGARGRKWRARVAPTQLEETGPQVDRMWESIVVSYQDVDGTTKTVGPPGSGAATESSDLKDSDSENPANKLGITRRDLLQMGTSTAAGAIEVGRRFLIESRLLDSSGRARIVGHCEDDKGVLHPYHRLRAGDYISFVDSNSPGYRRIVKTEKDHASRTCSIDLDSPPEGLAALLERLGVVLVPLGL